MNQALELRNLVKIYHKRGMPPFRAVDGLSLFIPRGQIFGFLGPNGAGKTTTIKMICGLIRPTSGTITVDGHDVETEHAQVMRSIGAVLEGTRNIYWQLSAWDNLMYFGRLKGVFGDELVQRAEELLKKLQLWNRRDDSVGGFSRGMQQKVAIACALISDPSVILLDEPTLGLDVQAAQTVKELVDELARTHNKTVILTTHQLDIAEQLCDRIAIIGSGKIITDKPITELLELFHEEMFEIILDGLLPAQVEFLHGCDVYEQDGATVIVLPAASMSELYRVMQIIQEHKLSLRSISKTRQTLEHVFVRLLEEQNV